MTMSYRETEADKFFREDAERLGYLRPGGRGLWTYYRDHGMIAPAQLESSTNDGPAEHEMTNIEWGMAEEILGLRIAKEDPNLERVLDCGD